jgi:hypothetical protein
VRAKWWYAPLVLVCALVTATAILYCAYVTLSPEYALGFGIVVGLTAVVWYAVVLVWWWFSRSADSGPPNDEA